MIGADDPVIGMLLMLLLSLLSVLPALHVYRLWFASGGEDAAESEEEDEDEEEDEEEDEAARRRAANIEMHGEDSARERAATNAFANAWNDLFPGLRAVTLNDFTLADLVVELPDGRWLGIQVKTTGAPVGRTGRRWDFSKVSRYPGMVVLCWTPAGPRTGWFGRWFDRWFGPRPCGWLYDGTWLAERKGAEWPHPEGPGHHSRRAEDACVVDRCAHRDPRPGWPEGHAGAGEEGAPPVPGEGAAGRRREPAVGALQHSGGCAESHLRPRAPGGEEGPGRVHGPLRGAGDPLRLPDGAGLARRPGGEEPPPLGRILSRHKCASYESYIHHKEAPDEIYNIESI